jgi:hypothetical protein
MVVGELDIRPAEYVAIVRGTPLRLTVRELEEALPGCRYIQTHFGFGYRLSCD